MTLRFLVFIALIAVIAPMALPQQPEKPLTKNQLMELVKAEMDNAKLAELVRARSIDFEPTEEDLQALRQAGAQDVLIAALPAVRANPLTRDKVLLLVAGGVPIERAAALVNQRGIDFLADEEYLNTLRLAGADDALIAAVREASARVVGELVVMTSPNAEVFLDGQSQGRADAQGKLKMRAKGGAHTLKVSLAGKLDFQQSLTLTSLQGTPIEARLVDAPGSIRLQTLPGASTTLDGASRENTNAHGELVISDVPPGRHELRVSAPEKKEYVQSVTVAPGQETRVEATLQDAPPSPGKVRANPKDGLKYVWIPPGTFVMGCSPDDSECENGEKPAHQVTLTRGFWIGQTVVTVGAYKRLTAATGKRMPKAPKFDSGWANENMPMVNVTWRDALDYCTRAGGRLPTEAEWEYAARAGSTQARYGPIDEIAWYKGNSGGRAHEVAQKRANGFGLFDVLGNVYEWVNDPVDWGSHFSLRPKNYYESSPSQDPPGPPSGETHVLRGGSWAFGPRDARVSSRVTGAVSTLPSEFVGFRCAREGDIP